MDIAELLAGIAERALTTYERSVTNEEKKSAKLDEITTSMTTYLARVQQRDAASTTTRYCSTVDEWWTFPTEVAALVKRCPFCEINHETENVPREVVA